MPPRKRPSSAEPELHPTESPQKRGPSTPPGKQRVERRAEWKTRRRQPAAMGMDWDPEAEAEPEPEPDEDPVMLQKLQVFCEYFANSNKLTPYNQLQRCPGRPEQKLHFILTPAYDDPSYQELLAKLMDSRVLHGVCLQLGLTRETGDVFTAEPARTQHWNRWFSTGKLANQGFEFERTVETDGDSWKPPAGQVHHRLVRPAWSQQRDQPVRGMMWCPVVAPRKPPQAPRSSQEAPQPAASEPGPSTPLPAKRSKRTKAEPAAEPNKAQGKAAKAKPAPQPGRWLDRDCNAALNMQRIGESKWWPLELCWWPEQGKLPAKGKEYPGLGYKRVKLVLLGTAIGEHGVSPGLCNINGELLVNYWLKALGPCPRLQPLASKVYIVTSPETHDHYLDWAAEKQASLGGFPATNLICTGVSRQPSQPLLDLAHALEHIPNIGTGWVVVASLNVFWGPQLPLQQLVERTIVRGKAGNQLVAAMQALTQRLSRPQHGAWPQTLTSNMVAAWWQHVANPNVKTLSYGKDSIVYCRPPPGHSLQGQYEVQLDQQGSSTATGACLNPRVAGIELQPQGASDGLHTCILTPLTLLHKSSLEGLRQAAGAQGHGSPFPPGTLQLGAVVKALLLGQGKPVYCLEVDMCCECISARGLEYASHFLQFMQDEQHKEAKQGPAARALTEVTLRGQACGVIPQTDADVEQLLAQASPLKRWLLRFDVIVDDMLAAQAAAHQAKSSTSLPLDMPFLGNKLPEGVPQRFHTLSTHR
ncbi:hypothetical protein QJQ45_005651 [Haematococcus lacustris]|nr:hypothetical protein QJQ45_005651 [Haematococcus lacustris]